MYESLETAQCVIVMEADVHLNKNAISSYHIKFVLKGSVWESDKLILNDGRWFPETADVIFFSEKFVF